MADVDDMFGDEPIVVNPKLSEVNGDSKIDSGEQTPVVSVAEEDADNRMETEEKVENGQSGAVATAEEAQKNCADDVMIIEDDQQNGTASNGDAKKPEIEAYVSETNIVMVKYKFYLILNYFEGEQRHNKSNGGANERSIQFHRTHYRNCAVSQI